MVYHAPYFALALPADWWVRVSVGADSQIPSLRIGYSLYSLEDRHRVTVFVWDQLTPTQFQDGICSRLADQVPDTFAGLPMRYATGDGTAAAFERIWTFASDQRIVYQLDTDDGPNGDVAAARENRAVLKTFAPEYPAWGCP